MRNGHLNCSASVLVPVNLPALLLQHIAISENMVRGFSRYHKYSIGADLRQLSREVVRLIISANNAADKPAVLLVLRDTIEQMKVTIRICKEVKAFKSFSAFQQAAELAVNISRQVEGWIKSAKKV